MEESVFLKHSIIDRTSIASRLFIYGRYNPCSNNLSQSLATAPIVNAIMKIRC